jgi:hypothetical protein
MSYPSLWPNRSPTGPVFGTGWDRITLGGDPLPGRAKILRGGAGLKRDEKKATGKSGSKPSYHGFECKDIEIQVACWLDNHFDAMDAWLKKHGPQPDKSVRPEAIDAAALRHLPVKYAKVIEVSEWKEASEFGRGGRMLTLLAQAYTKPVKTTQTSTPKPKRHINNAVTDGPQARNPEPTDQQSIAGPPNFTPG